MSIELHAPDHWMTAEEYSAAVRDTYTQSREESDAGRSAAEIARSRAEREFLLTVEFRLGPRFSESKRERLLDLHREMRAESLVVIRRHVRGETSARRHSQLLGHLNDRYRERMSAILTPDEFRLMSGEDR